MKKEAEGGKVDVVSKYKLSGPKLNQNEIDALVARLKGEKKQEENTAK